MPGFFNCWAISLTPHPTSLSETTSHCGFELRSQPCSSSFWHLAFLTTCRTRFWEIQLILSSYEVIDSKPLPPMHACKIYTNRHVPRLIKPMCHVWRSRLIKELSDAGPATPQSSVGNSTSMEAARAVHWNLSETWPTYAPSHSLHPTYPWHI